MRKGRMFLSGTPLGASLLVALIPGPCTTFDDVTPPAPVDTPICDGGLTFAFDASVDCEQLYGNCCAQIHFCAESRACKTWVECVNDCPLDPGRDAACTNKCGPTVDASFGSILLDLDQCRDFYDASACVYP